MLEEGAAASAPPAGGFQEEMNAGVAADLTAELQLRRCQSRNHLLSAAFQQNLFMDTKQENNKWKE